MTHTKMERLGETYGMLIQWNMSWSIILGASGIPTGDFHGQNSSSVVSLLGFF